jgi:very-short-patch-repair endonuclease
MKLSLMGLRPALRWAREVIMQHQLSASRKQLIAERARLMRFAQTSSEFALWQAIRCGALGVAFKRQYPVGRFIADVAAPAAKLIVEIDGAYHARRATADARRDRYLRRAGYRVVRIPAELVMRDIAAAVQLVRVALVVG